MFGNDLELSEEQILKRIAAKEREADFYKQNARDWPLERMALDSVRDWKAKLAELRERVAIQAEGR